MHLLIIGVGSIGERHLRNFLRIEGVRCSIAEPDEEQRRKMTAEYEVVRSFRAWEEADLSDFDGAVICTPTDQHVPMMMQLVDAEVPVLSEKPIAMKLEGISELRQRIQEKKVVTGVAFCMRHHPLMVEIKDRIDGGDLGTVRVAQGYSGQYWPQMRKGWPPAYAIKRETGGGAIPDHLVHLINLLEWYFGPTISISAFQRHMELPDIQTEDFGSITMRFPGGRVAQLTICLFQRDVQMRFQVIGDRGTARFEIGADRLQLFNAQSGDWEEGNVQAVDRDDMFVLQAKHFLECIRGAAEPRCTVEEAEHTLRTVLAGVESSDGSSQFIHCAATAD
jgi:predicted dehydrogenase